MPARRDPDAYLRVLAGIDDLPDSANIRIPVVRALLGGIGNSTYYRWVAEGKIPAPEKLSARVSANNVGKLRAAGLIAKQTSK